MDILLWIIQIILAIKLLTVTVTHGFQQSKPTMQESIQRVGKAATRLHILAAAGTFSATLGLLLPGVMTLPTWVTPAAAVFSGLLLLISIFFHIKGREKPMVFVSLILSALAVIVAYGRWMLFPF